MAHGSNSKSFTIFLDRLLDRDKKAVDKHFISGDIVRELIRKWLTKNIIKNNIKEV